MDLGTGPEFYDKNGVKYPTGCTEVLNHGFVRLVDSMGDDSSIVQAARVSHGKGTKQVSEDRGLIRYLMRHLHTTPFEMVEFKFHMRMPIFVARQWIRHRTANVNEYSGRYSEMPDLFYVPAPEQVTKQSSSNKQGGTDERLPDDIEIMGAMIEEQNFAFEQYKKYLGKDMRKELARINLPLSIYTEWYWKIDLHNLFHFLRLRLDSHAQYEIRVFAEAMVPPIKEKCPIAWEAFEDYILKSMRLSGLEIEVFQKAAQCETKEDFAKVIESVITNKREREECVAKLKKLFPTIDL